LVKTLYIGQSLLNMNT